MRHAPHAARICLCCHVFDFCPRAVFFDAGIFDGDLAVVDRSIEAVHGHIVIALLNTEPLCKRLCLRGKDVILLSENPKYPPRYVMDGDELVWDANKVSS